MKHQERDEPSREGEGENTLLRCKFCGKQSNILDVETAYQKQENTLTNLDDRNSVLWKCLHCGCFN